MAHIIPYVTQDEDPTMAPPFPAVAAPPVARIKQGTPKQRDLHGNIVSPPNESVPVKAFKRKNGTPVRAHRRTVSNKQKQTPKASPKNVPYKKPSKKKHLPTRLIRSPMTSNTRSLYKRDDLIGIDDTVKKEAISIRISEMLSLVKNACLKPKSSI